MGLDTSHNAWHGAYSAFMRWRREVAKAAGLPPLDLMEGFYIPTTESRTNPTFFVGGKGMDDWRIKMLEESLPISWGILKPDPLHELLCHSDCDGQIAPENCGPIADSLERLIPKMPTPDMKDVTKAFVDGLRLAAQKGEPLAFR